MKKNRWSALLLFAIMLLGAGLVLYPTVSSYWNSLHSSYAIASYTDEVEKIDRAKYDRILDEALAYNENLLKRENALLEGEGYWNQLEIGGQGVMGYVEIPSIDVLLPIYHGDNLTVLQTATGHLPWTSLPVGGETSHCVISGHRGLPEAKLFTDLDRMEVDDVFMLHVLDETLTYRVDRISIVEPKDISMLQIEAGKDLCTLMTCTPYGVNSHRLLIRGHRIANEDTETVTIINANATKIRPLLVGITVSIPILLILFIWLMLGTKSKKKSK